MRTSEETHTRHPDALGFVRTYPPTALTGDTAYYLLFRKGDLLVRPNSAGDLHLPLAPLSDPPLPGLQIANALYLGTLNGIACLALSVHEDTALPPDWQATGLRPLYGKMPDAEYAVAVYALQLLHFQTISKFCPVCATATSPLTASWAKECPHCGHTTYPLVSPAVLILVHDGGDRLLLAQKPGWGTRYSILAGFVEPGESLEECVIRETQEEAGIAVHSLRYDGSQPWPYPHQVMIGFTATGDPADPLVLDTIELARAEWFDVRVLPDLPPPLSLSRQMIDRWIASRGAGIVYPNLGWG